MLNTDSTAAERLRNTIDYTKKRPATFAKLIGASQPAISMILSGKNKSISTDLGKKITDFMPEINPEWLLFGRGEMFRKSVSEQKNTDDPEVSIRYEKIDVLVELSVLWRKVSSLESEIASIRSLLQDKTHDTTT